MFEVSGFEFNIDLVYTVICFCFIKDICLDVGIE